MLVANEIEASIGIRANREIGENHQPKICPMAMSRLTWLDYELCMLTDQMGIAGIIICLLADDGAGIVGVKLTAARAISGHGVSSAERK